MRKLRGSAEVVLLVGAVSVAVGACSLLLASRPSPCPVCQAGPAEPAFPPPVSGRGGG